MYRFCFEKCMKSLEIVSKFKKLQEITRKLRNKWQSAKLHKKLVGKIPRKKHKWNRNQNSRISKYFEEICVFKLREIYMRMASRRRVPDRKWLLQKFKKYEISFNSDFQKISQTLAMKVHLFDDFQPNNARTKGKRSGKKLMMG